MIQRILAGGLILSLLIAVPMVDAAENKMTRDEYVAKLAEYTKREADASNQLQQLDGDIASLNAQIATLDNDIAGLKSDILGLVGATEGQIGAYGGTLDGLIRQLQGLTALAPEERVRHLGEIKDVAMQLEELKSNPICAIPDMTAKVRRIEALLADLKIRDVVTISYEVSKGDHLWGIASDESIYGDPYMWPRIYKANTDQITDPDLIYPEQKLSVPFGVSEGQYLVTGGDFLSKIAAAVYNDATMWHKIYKANMDQIVEPGMIFPAQVLEVPSN